MSSHHGSQKLRRNGSPSTNKSVSGPLRATLPISFMSQNLVHSEVAKPGVNTSNLNPVQIIQTKITPSTTSKSSHLPAYGRSGHSPWRIRQWSPTPKDNCQITDSVTLDCPVIRRTASLDAIYLKGQWPRGNYQQIRSKLFVDKSTQTPDEWQDPLRYPCQGMESSPSREWKQKQRIFNCVQLNLPRFEYSTSTSAARVAVSTNTEYFSHRTAKIKDGSLLSASQAIPVPCKPSQTSSRVRNSVEGFNPEIEKLIRRGSEQSATNIYEPAPDGHRAPIAELFKTNSASRSVDTQTPIRTGSPKSSADSSPAGSVSPMTWSVYDHCRPADGDSLSPEDLQGLSLGTSPEVSRFLCREPPDGCEKVTLKVLEQFSKCDQDMSTCFARKPSAIFVLQPSSGSAFSPLCKIPSLRSNSGSQLFANSYGNVGEANDRASSVPPQWPTASPVVQKISPSADSSKHD